MKVIIIWDTLAGVSGLLGVVVVCVGGERVWQGRVLHLINRNNIRDLFEVRPPIG